MNLDTILARITALEGHVTHLERQCDELNSVVVEQGKALERLQRKLNHVGDTIDSFENERLHQSKEKPPHYLP